MTIPLEQCEHLYRYVWKEITDNKCQLLRIGGIQNHLHILINLNPTVALAPLIQSIKSKSSGWLKKDERFPCFEGWASEYYAASLSINDKDAVVEYIKNQQQHHLSVPFDDELQSLCQASALACDENFMR